LLELLNVQWSDGFEWEVPEGFQEVFECTRIQIASAHGEICLRILLYALVEPTEVHPSWSIQM